MTNSNEISQTNAQVQDPSAPTTLLMPDEAQILQDWVRSEQEGANNAPETKSAIRSERLRAIAAEIDDLVGHRQTLVADDLEERMIALLVGDLDPKSQTRLEISRDIAQVTAEKDHLDATELIRRFTQIAGRTLRMVAGQAPLVSVPSTAQAMAGAGTADSPASLTPVTAARARPIPRPSKIPPRRPSRLQRLLGRK